MKRKTKKKPQEKKEISWGRKKERKNERKWNKTKTKRIEKPLEKKPLDFLNLV